MKRQIVLLVVHLLGAVLILAGAGCTPKNQDSGERRPTMAPSSLVPVKIIEGRILGRIISRPAGVRVDDFGNVFVIDAGNNRLIKFDRELNPQHEAGGFGSGEGQMNEPTYLALDNNLNVYVADAGNRRVVHYDSRLNYSDKIDLMDIEDPLKFGQPAGLGVGRSGEVWVVDKDRSRISVFDTFGKWQKFVGDLESTPAYLLNPTGLTVTDDEAFLVCDAGNGVIKELTYFGIYSRDIGEDVLKEPSGAAVDKSGNIWVADAFLGKIFAFDKDGRLISSFGEKGNSGDMTFSRPADLALTPDGHIIISDSERNRLVKYKIDYLQK